MKVLMIIAQRDFRDEEFKVPYDYFISQKLTVDVASDNVGDCIGKFGLQVVADRSFDDVNVSEYFAVVFVGGPGAYALIGDSRMKRIIDVALKQNIVISAICIAPMILASAGALSGKQAVVWDEDEKQSPKFDELGVKYVDSNVVVDGLFVTARDYKAAQEFAEKIIEIAECEKCHIRGIENGN